MVFMACLMFALGKCHSPLAGLAGSVVALLTILADTSST